MAQTFEAIFVRQVEIITQLEKIESNFRKDSASRKTQDYLDKRVKVLDELWAEFQQNDSNVQAYEDKNYEYFIKNIFQMTKEFYETTRAKMTSYKPFSATLSPLPVPEDKKEMFSQISFSIPTISKDDKATQPGGPADEIWTQQKTNFRALMRQIQRISIENLEEKWEIEDELRNIQRKWQIIEETHLKIDNILQGSDVLYDSEYTQVEDYYYSIKKKLNKKLCSTAHLQQSTPQIEIPVFTGNYTNWPTFFDLFSEAIHKNKYLSNAQKMQHLKGKVRGEPERLIQHLHVSAENYETAWDILTHRYDNPQVLFTKQIEVFLNQPYVQRQTAFELKRLYDVTTECIHAIHNLGVDTNTWDPLLVHLLAKKLDSHTYSDYMESRKQPRELPKLVDFMQFIESKFTALEPIHLRASSYKQNNQSSPQVSKPSYSKPKNQGNHIFKNYQALPTFTSRCSFCNQNHDLFQCKKFLSQSPESIMRTISKLKICKNCLYKHVDNICHSTKRCKECNGEHNTLIHDAMTQQASNASNASLQLQQARSLPPATAKQTPNKSEIKQHSVNHVATEDEEILLTTLSLKVKSADSTYITLTALLDQGSQISLLSENAAQMLGLQRQRFNASIPGIGTSSKVSKGVVTMECQSVYDDYQFSTQALVITNVINNLPNSSFRKQTWPHLQHIRLADPEYNVSKPIDILLDASVYSDIIMSGLIKGPSQAPIAQQTKLGWILSGNVRTFNCNVVINNIDDITKFWDIEEISSNSASSLTKEEQYCEDFYLATTRRLECGRYEVALPMKPHFEQHLGTSKPKAIAQFLQQEKRMIKNEQLSASYIKFMKEYQELNHMRPSLSENTDHPECYLPHHGVLKPDSTTTKLRTVFNASSPTSSGYSLNDLMECGPNLQQDLQSLILKWRQHKYVLTADIEKMFRCIAIRTADQQLLKIVWRDSPHQLLKDYYLTTLTYGTKVAPFLAMRTLKQIARDNPQYELAASALENSFYMDDLVWGHNSLAEAKSLQQQLISVLQGAGMNIRKWASNDPELVKDLASEQLESILEFKDTQSRKTLGLKWTPSSDSFTFQYDISDNNQCNTKRQLLSSISKIFDPLGWLSPLTIRAKIMFQKIWSFDLAWDDELPAELLKEWTALKDDLESIQQLKIPRHFGNTERNYQLHGFCDASERAYACAIYIVTTNDKGECISKLVIAKTKVAPRSKQISLARLELCGSLLLAQLMKRVLESLSKSDIKVHAWTDSMIVLGWLQGEPSRWKQFVANRVTQITDIIPASNWSHVRSEENAADCASRGLTSSKLADFSLWWEGPKWLSTLDTSKIKKIIYQCPTLEEKKASVNVALQSKQNNELIFKLLNNYSDIAKAVKAIGWISRYISWLGNRHTSRDCTLSTTELNNAYNIIIRSVQSIDFQDELISLKSNGQVSTKSKIASLNPFLDDQGILRVGGRLHRSNLKYTAKHPIILSSSSRLTELIIQQSHLITLHGGPRLTLSHIRDKYWIISGIRTVKKQLRQCVKCRRFNHIQQQQIMGTLPGARVTRPARLFSNCGVDFTGYLDIKSNKGRGVKTTKGYVAVFICLSTKAVHLEMVSNLSTAAFLAAFRRMCARRGTPNNMFSDNGTNFVGANRELKQEYKSILKTMDTSFIKDVSEMGVTWHFNAPAWPNAGGLWEAAVKSLKHHLKRVLGDQKLTYEEFITLLHQVEACLNSRPLYALTESPEDDILTPGHFLVGSSLISRPQTDPDTINLTTRWKLVQSMNKQFWRKWSTDYLQHLQSRSKWRFPTRNLQIDDIVLLKEENLPPGKWAMGRILELHPGKDGYVRVVTLKTKSNVIKRPINKLVLLPVCEESTKQEHQSSEQTQQHSQDQPSSSSLKLKTRTSRAKGKLFRNFFTTIFLFMTVLSPSTQQETTNFNITTFKQNTPFYFDRISDLQHIRDDWKLVVYYNMSTYWNGLHHLEQYVNHIMELCTNTNNQYRSVVLQLQHELSEIEHYNKLLMNHQHRIRKRGLINGVGYIANSLFGVLDDRFADQYKIDIEKIARNENHLKNLIKNQTLIIESEYNILRRNENIMNQQFTFIKNHLHNVSVEVNEVRLDIKHDAYITSSALAATVILANLRRIQETLINTITDISQGRVDIHLLSPQQLEAQTNFIMSQLQSDLTLPVGHGDMQSLYKLLKMHSKIVDNYLIIEIRIPILSSESYQLDKIISLPQISQTIMFQIVPAFNYIAFNIRKDVGMYLSESDLHLCIHYSQEKLLCSLDKPIYQLKIKQSICDVSVTNDEYSKTLTCITDTIACRNKWIKLQRPNVWLYSCCKECRVHIFCSSGVEIKTLQGNGLITLGQGCALKGESFTIYSHNNFFNHLKKEDNLMEFPQMSILNSIINTSTSMEIDAWQPEKHNELYKEVKMQIEDLKRNEAKDLTIHDIHHYTLLYGILAGIVIGGVVLSCLWRRRRRLQEQAAGAAAERVVAPVTRAGDVIERGIASAVISVCSENEAQKCSVKSVEQGTSPIVLRPAKFEVPIANSEV